MIRARFFYFLARERDDFMIKETIEAEYKKVIGQDRLFLGWQGYCYAAALIVWAKLCGYR